MEHCCRSKTDGAYGSGLRKPLFGEALAEGASWQRCQGLQDYECVVLRMSVSMALCRALPQPPLWALSKGIQPGRYRRAAQQRQHVQREPPDSAPGAPPEAPLHMHRGAQQIASKVSQLAGKPDSNGAACVQATASPMVACSQSRSRAPIIQMLHVLSLLRAYSILQILASGQRALL